MKIKMPILSANGIGDAHKDNNYCDVNINNSVAFLKYIVVNVFDTSISALMEIFKSQIKNIKE